MSRSSRWRNSSAARRCTVPLPPEAKLILPGCALALAARSATLRTGESALTTTTLGMSSTSDSGCSALRA